MAQALKLDPKEQTQHAMNRLGGVMRALGYTNKKCRIGYRSGRVWVRIGDATGEEEPVPEG
jgi:hypothetical protein